MCALAKRVKVGGSYYKGYKLVVSATPGDYVLDMTIAQNGALNGITIIPDTYGAGDYMTLQHLRLDGTVKATLGDTVYNVGANAAWQLDFSSLELMETSEKLRLTYTNVAGQALNVYTLIERIQ